MVEIYFLEQPIYCSNNLSLEYFDKENNDHLICGIVMLRREELILRFLKPLSL